MARIFGLPAMATAPRVVCGMWARSGATTSTQLSTTNNNLRQPAIYGGQLYVSSGNGSTVRLRHGRLRSAQYCGTNHHHAARISGHAESQTPLSCLTSMRRWLVVDTLYIADDGGTTGGILKYSFDGSTWTARVAAREPRQMRIAGLTASPLSTA